MATYIQLGSWTEQGIRNVKDVSSRIDAARAMAREHGVELKDVYMLMGEHDILGVYEAPDDDAMAAVALKLGKAGNIRTVTYKAFPEKDFRRLTSAVS